MAEYTVRLYFRGGMTLDVPITLADDEEPDLEWFLGESSDPEERTPVLSEGQFAWKSAEIIAAEWYEDEAEPEAALASAVVTTPDAEPVATETTDATDVNAETAPITPATTTEEKSAG